MQEMDDRIETKSRGELGRLLGVDGIFDGGVWSASGGCRGTVISAKGYSSDDYCLCCISNPASTVTQTLRPTDMSTSAPSSFSFPLLTQYSYLMPWPSTFSPFPAPVSVLS